MATILIWMSPEPGHLFPLFKIAQDLVQFGHPVVFQVPNSLRSEVEKIGFSTVGLFEACIIEQELRLFASTVPAKSFYEAVRQSFPSEVAYRAAFLREIRQAAARALADIVIIDGLFDDALGLSASGVFDPRRLIRMHIQLPYGSYSLSTFFGPLGVPVILSPAVFEMPSRIIRGACYTEAALFSGYPQVTGNNVWDDQSDSRGLVYCSLGTQLARYEAAPRILSEICEFATRRPDLRVIVNAGPLASAFAHVRSATIVPAVPQRSILERAAIMITHGGFGAVKECVWHRVPMVVIPQAYDQMANADRITVHRIGVRLDTHQVSADTLDSAVSSLLACSSIQEHLQSMSDEFRKCEGEARTARLCERVLSGGRGVHR